MRTVHVQHDEHGPIEIVEEAEGKLRSLRFGSTARQSTMFTARPTELALEYTRTMASGLVFLPHQPTRVLVLGLGGGSLPKFLLHHYPQCQVDVVEIRPAIAEVANRFFGLPEPNDRFCLHLTDGLEFLESVAASTYDLIFVDLHNANGMAPIVDAESFPQSCRKAMRGGGVAIYNLWFGVRPEQEQRLSRRLDYTFDHLLRLPIAGKLNCVAFGLTKSEIDLATLAGRSEIVGPKLGLAISSMLIQLQKRHPQVLQ